MQAERFREILTDLGPAFVKIGQVGTNSLLLIIDLSTLCVDEASGER